MSGRERNDRDTEEAIDAAVRTWVGDKELAVTEHPEIDALVDYQEGRLDSGAAEHLQRHLVVCPSCRRELLQLHAFDQELPENSELYPPQEVSERSWRRFEAARVAMRATSSTNWSGPEANLSGFRGSLGLRLKFAASILLALAAGAVLAVLVMGRGQPEKMASTGSPFVFDLDPEGRTVLRAAASVPEVVLPLEMDPLVARLNLPDLNAYEGYLVEVRDREGRLVVRRESLVRDRAGSVTFWVPRAEWPAGEYHVLLVALDDGRRRELASYAFRLRYQS